MLFRCFVSKPRFSPKSGDPRRGLEARLGPALPSPQSSPGRCFSCGAIFSPSLSRSLLCVPGEPGRSPEIISFSGVGACKEPFRASHPPCAGLPRAADKAAEPGTTAAAPEPGLCRSRGSAGWQRGSGRGVRAPAGFWGLWGLGECGYRIPEIISVPCLPCLHLPAPARSGASAPLPPSSLEDGV